MDIKLIKGDLSMASLNGSIEANIEEGNIEVENLAGYFSAVTKLGDLMVALAGPRWRGFGFTAATQRGSIDLTIPPDYSAALQLETKDGKISVDFPEQIVEGESVPLQVMAKKKACAITAPIGSGGAPIKLITASGDINLKKTEQK